MTDDPGLKLLAAVEALAGEVRGMRAEMREEREGRESAARLRKSAADRQARHRSRNSNVTPTTTPKPEVGVGNGAGHVTDNVTVTSRVQVVKKEQEKKKDQEQEIAALRDSDVTSRDTWLSFSKAYFDRYGAEPVRNAKINGQLLQFVKRLGVDDAPHVAEFFLSHNAAFYVQQGHAVGLLLKDAEKLHMEWRTKKPINGTAARQLERSAANADGWMQAARAKP